MMFQTLLNTHTIKHFSFDLWLTLIRSNALFKEKRAFYFHEKFNTNNKSLGEIKSIFKNVDILSNALNEKTGKNISAEEMYLMVISQVNESTELFKDIDLELLYTDMEYMVLQYMPKIFCDHTAAVLDKLKNKPGVTLNILSNTAFIKGSTLKKVNQHLGISKYFDFEIYSDEVGVSKPNIEIYSHLIKNVYRVNGSSIELNEILHVGDNYHADILGAQKSGIHAFQINTNQHSITHLLN
jgi:putative hydrolase of the HAD superfamily